VPGVSITVEGVTKRYALDGGIPLVALDAVSLHIAAGAAVALTGPSGSGKSTLLHLLGGLDRADAGRMRVGEHELSTLGRAQLPAYRRGVGFVFQRFNLLQAQTALGNVLMPLAPYRVAFDRHQRARDLLAAVGLAGRENALPAQLSGGQQQRIAIARALINDPVLLLADEPTGNLDTTTGAGIVDLILGLRDSRGMTVVLATHDEQVATRCDEIVRLRDGRVLVQV
jgi:putative ABC transport system ATP-binding protein